MDYVFLYCTCVCLCDVVCVVCVYTVLCVSYVSILILYCTRVCLHSLVCLCVYMCVYLCSFHEVSMFVSCSVLYDVSQVTLDWSIRRWPVTSTVSYRHSTWHRSFATLFIGLSLSPVCLPPVCLSLSLGLSLSVSLFVCPSLSLHVTAQVCLSVHPSFCVSTTVRHCRVHSISMHQMTNACMS